MALFGQVEKYSEQAVAPGKAINAEAVAVEVSLRLLCHTSFIGLDKMLQQ